MPNAIFVCHPVSFLPHRRPPPALACRRRSMPSSSVTIAVHGSRHKPPQSSSPIRCLRRLSLLSRVTVVSRRRPPSFQFIARRLACHCRSTPSSSVAIAVGGSCRKPPQSLSPIRCLRRLSPLSLVVVVSRWRPPSFQFYRPPPPPRPPSFLVGGRHYRHILSAVAAPLVAGAVARQLQSLVSVTVTSKHPDKR